MMRLTDRRDKDNRLGRDLGILVVTLAGDGDPHRDPRLLLPRTVMMTVVTVMTVAAAIMITACICVCIRACITLVTQSIAGVVRAAAVTHDTREEG